MSLTGDDHQGAYAYLKDLEDGPIERAAPAGVSQGSIGYGAGGPVYLDAFHSKRPPSPSELVNAYKAVAFACISINANAVAKVPFRLYCRTGRGQLAPRFWPTRRLDRREKGALLARMHRHQLTRGMTSSEEDIDEIVDHPLLSVLDNPNPHFDGNALVQLLARSLDAIGSAYWYPERAGPDWAPSVIWPLHSQYCYPTKGVGRQIIANYVYFGDTFGPDELIRFRYTSLRDPYLSGYAPLHACFEQLGLIDYYTATIESTLKGGSRPEGIIGPKDPKQPWTRAERLRVDADVNSRFGNGNQGRVWTTDGSFDFQPLSYGPMELGGLAITKDARLLAANCFDVPISMLEAESSNKATASEGATQHQRNAVEPRLAIISSGLTHQCARRIDDRLFFMADDAVQKDILSAAKVHDIYLSQRVLSRNETRADLGLPPTEGGDDFDPAPSDSGKTGRPQDRPDHPSEVGQPHQDDDPS